MYKKHDPGPARTGPAPAGPGRPRAGTGPAQVLFIIKYIMFIIKNIVFYIKYQKKYIYKYIKTCFSQLFDIVYKMGMTPAAKNWLNEQKYNF